MTGRVAMEMATPKHTDGKLHQAEGIIEPGNTSLGTAGGKIGVDKNIDLGGGKADHRRNHQDHNPAQTFVFEIQMGPPDKPRFFKRRDLDGQLQKTADQGPHRHADNRGLTKGRGPPGTETPLRQSTPD